jgi:iron-sulfur cluster repair protein YtfE (RIC family)
MTGTENIKRRNEKLRAGIEAAATLRDQLGELSPEQVCQGLDRVLAFCRHEVAPHARAEERVFYPEVSAVLGIELGERMVGEHRYIGELVNDVTEIRHRVAAEGSVPTELYGALTNLVELVRAHLRLEEEVLERMGDGKLSESDLYFLYERIEEAEFDAITDLSAPRTEATAPRA